MGIRALIAEYRGIFQPSPSLNGQGPGEVVVMKSVSQPVVVAMVSRYGWIIGGVPV